MDNKSILLGLVVLTLSCIYLFYLNHTKYKELDELSNEVKQLKMLNNLTQSKLVEMLKDKSLSQKQPSQTSQSVHAANDVVPLTKENIKTFENQTITNEDHLELTKDDIQNIDNLDVIEVDVEDENNDEEEEVEIEGEDELEELVVQELEVNEPENTNEKLVIEDDNEDDNEDNVVDNNENEENNTDIILEDNQVNGELNLDDLGDEGSELNLDFGAMEEINTEPKIEELEDDNNEDDNENDSQLNFDNVDSMTIKELKVVAKNMNLKIKGNKEELSNRIKENISKNL